MKKLKVGLIGPGAFAHIARLPVLAGMESVELTACMALTQKVVDAAARQFGFTQKFTNLRAMINEADIDAVIVATPKPTHFEIVIPLLEKGIHVFCEKPIALSIAQAREMAACAQANRRVLMIGFNRRYAPVYEWAKQEFADRPPDVCVALKNRPGTEYRATMENTIHMVDLLRYFCGECASVTAHSKFSNKDYEDSIEALLKFENGAVGLLVGNRTCGQWMERLELYGNGKTVIVSCPDEITVVDHQQEHTRRMTPMRSGWATVEEKMGFRQEMEAFIDAVTTGSVPRTAAADSVESHVLLNRILQSAGLPGMEA